IAQQLCRADLLMRGMEPQDRHYPCPAPPPGGVENGCGGRYRGQAGPSPAPRPLTLRAGSQPAAQIVAAPVGSCLRWWDGGYDARRTDRRAHRRSRAAPGEGPRTTDLATRPAVLDGRRRALG